MTESELAELNRKIAVMEASKTKEIERKDMSTGRWIGWQCPDWNWEFFDYRVKQNPRRAMVTVAANGKFIAAYNVELEMGAIKLRRETRNDLIEFIELTPEVKQKLGITD